MEALTVMFEPSAYNVQLWADICVARQRGLILICLADFGQYEAIAQNWAGTPVPPHALQASAMLRELCGANRFTLTENKRSDRLHPGPAPWHRGGATPGGGARRRPGALPPDRPGTTR